MHQKNTTTPQEEELLPWHKPEIQQLIISLDTESSFSSTEPDGPLF